MLEILGADSKPDKGYSRILPAKKYPLAEVFDFVHCCIKSTIFEKAWRLGWGWVFF